MFISRPRTTLFEGGGDGGPYAELPAAMTSENVRLDGNMLNRLIDWLFDSMNLDIDSTALRDSCISCDEGA